MAQNNASMDGGDQTINATVSVESVVKAIKLNETHGVDDRVIAVPRSGGEAKIRRAFKGSERYANPESAPIHIRPESLVESEWRTMPNRGHVDKMALDLDDKPREEWTEADEENFEKGYEAVLEVWESDVRSMVRGVHDLETEPKINLEAQDDE